MHASKINALMFYRPLIILFLLIIFIFLLIILFKC